MAETRTCEVCGATGARHIEWAYTEYDAVAPGQPTSTTEAIDVCDDHRDAALAKLADHVVETFREQIPYHQRLSEHREKIDALTAQAAQTRAPLAAHALAVADLGDKAGPVDEDAVAAHKGVLAELNLEEKGRRETLAEATAKHDERVAAFRASLK